MLTGADDSDARYRGNNNAEWTVASRRMSANGWYVDVMAQFGILEAHEVAELLNVRHSTVLDLSRRGILPAFKIGKHGRYRRCDLGEWIANRRDSA